MPQWSRRKGGTGHGTRAARRRNRARFCLEWTDAYGIEKMRMLETRNVAEWTRDRMHQLGLRVSLREL